MRKSVGKVTDEEKNAIQALFERKNGLAELAKILTPDKQELYERLVADMGATETKFQQWWDDMSAKYQWESLPNGHWEIDFSDGQIYLTV